MKILLLANTDWYLYNYRLPLALALQEKGAEVILVSPPGRYHEKLQQAGFRWLPVEISRRGANPFLELAAVKNILRLYQKEKPDVAHHFTIKCVLYGSIAAKFAGVPVVINAITGLGYVFYWKNLFTSLVRPLVKCLYRYSLRYTRVVFQNEDNRITFVSQGLVKPEQTFLIPGSGVDVKRFVPIARKESIPLVVLPARMLMDKGIKEFIEAGKAVEQSGIKTRFALVGDIDPGNPSSIPVETLKSWLSDGGAEWWGWQDDMLSIYQRASIVCLPSYYGEGLAKSLIEGAACGCALVATDIPGCREVVQHGKNGFLIPPRDSAALADAVKKILEDDQLRKSMGEASRRLAIEVFDVNRIVESTIRIYDIE